MSHPMILVGIRCIPGIRCVPILRSSHESRSSGDRGPLVFAVSVQFLVGSSLAPVTGPQFLTPSSPYQPDNPIYDLGMIGSSKDPITHQYRATPRSRRCGSGRGPSVWWRSSADVWWQTNRIYGTSYMYIYTYTYVYRCIYCICMYMYVCVYMPVHIDIYIYITYTHTLIQFNTYSSFQTSKKLLVTARCKCNR